MMLKMGQSAKCFAWQWSKQAYLWKWTKPCKPRPVNACQTRTHVIGFADWRDFDTCQGISFDHRLHPPGRIFSPWVKIMCVIIALLSYRPKLSHAWHFQVQNACGHLYCVTQQAVRNWRRGICKWSLVFFDKGLAASQLKSNCGGFFAKISMFFSFHVPSLVKSSLLP